MTQGIAADDDIAPPEFKYEEAMQEVRSIVRSFQDNEVPVDQMFEEAQRGALLLRQGRAKLQRVESDIRREVIGALSEEVSAVSTPA